MLKLQLFALLQDTVCFIQHGQHLAPNYHHCKKVVLDQYGLGARTSAKKLLVCIGDQYFRNGWYGEFDAYLKKYDKSGLVAGYNEELNKMAKD
jgi:hypothetical protein